MFSDTRGLSHHCQGDFAVFFVLGKPGADRLRPVEDQRILAPAGHAHHLRMVGLANDDGPASLLLCLGHQGLDTP